MARIIFVKSPGGVKKNNNFYIGLFSLGTILQEENHWVRVIDFDYIISNNLIQQTEELNENIDIMCDYILKDDPDIVDFYTMTSIYYLTIRLSKRLKEKKENIKIVLGGPQASLIAKETLKICDWIDLIGVGEGEQTISNIINKLVNNVEFDNDPGVAYLKDGEVIVNETILMDDLDKAPRLDYSLLEGEIDQKIQLDVGRGCPFGCKYCSTKTFWKRHFRLKSAERIVSEIKEIIDKFGVTNFEFQHDLFTVNKNKILEFCKELKRNNINITWRCSSRADTLDEELIKTMKEAGCTSMYLGIETGSKKMQKIINKNLNLDKALNTIMLLKKYGIVITTSFIYGFPEETEADLNDTLDLIIKVILTGADAIQFHLLSVYPGTEYCEELQDSLYFSNTLSDGSYSKYLDGSKESIEFIKRNKNIFPQYLDFDMGIRREVDYIDTYIQYFAKIFIRYFVKTYESLYKIIGSHLGIFERFKEANLDYLENNENLIRTRGISFEDIVMGIQNLVQFIEVDYSEALVELFNFEVDILKFIYFTDKPELKKTYKYDVYSIKKSSIGVQDSIINNTDICFYRLNDKNDINIKKVDL